jgi:hypothetical protein
LLQHLIRASDLKAFHADSSEPAGLRNKTYPLRTIVAALTDYDIGCTLEETTVCLAAPVSYWL